MKLPRRIDSLKRNLLRRPDVEDDLDEELRAFTELLVSEKVRDGLSEDEARRSAAREIGAMDQVKEQVRDVRAVTMLEQFIQDLRFGLRTLVRSPGFAVVAALSLALGIGGTTAMFSLVYTVLLQPLPYPEPDRLVSVTGHYPKGAIATMDERSRTLSIAGFTTATQFNLTGERKLSSGKAAWCRRACFRCWAPEPNSAALSKMEKTNRGATGLSSSATSYGATDFVATME